MVDGLVDNLCALCFFRTMLIEVKFRDGPQPSPAKPSPSPNIPPARVGLGLSWTLGNAA